MRLRARPEALAVSSIIVGALTAGLIVAGPAHAGDCDGTPCEDPTGVSATALPTSVVIPAGRTGPWVRLAATFNDPAETVDRVRIQVTRAAGAGVRTFEWTARRSGSQAVASGQYRPSAQYPPGGYSVKFTPIPRAGASYEVVPTLAAAFVVRHQTRLTVSLIRGKLARAKMRILGLFTPQNAATVGQAITLSFRAKHTKHYRKLATTKVKARGKFAFGKRPGRAGKYQVRYLGSTYLTPSSRTFRLR